MNGSQPWADVLTFDEAQQRAYDALSQVLNFASFGLCFLQVLIFLLVQRSFPGNMPLFLGVANLLRAASQIPSALPDVKIANYPWLCMIQAAVSQYLNWATLLWFFFIALHLYQVRLERLAASRIRALELWAHLVSWLAPLVPTVVPIALGKYGSRGPHGEWCWLTGEDSGLWGFAFYYIPGFLLLLAVTFFWLRVVRVSLQVSSQLKTKIFLIHRLAALVVFILLFLWQLSHRVLSVLELRSYALEMIHLCATSTWGIYMFLGFGLTYDNVLLLHALWKKKCGATEESRPPPLLAPSSDDEQNLLTGTTSAPPWLRPSALGDSPRSSVRSGSASSGSPGSIGTVPAAFSLSSSSSQRNFKLTGYLARPTSSDEDLADE